MALDDGYDGDDTGRDGGDGSDVGSGNSDSGSGSVDSTSSAPGGGGLEGGSGGPLDSGPGGLDGHASQTGNSSGGLEGSSGGGVENTGGSRGGGQAGFGGRMGGLDGSTAPDQGIETGRSGSKGAWDALGSRTVDSSVQASGLRGGRGVESSASLETSKGLENGLLGNHNKNGAIDRPFALDSGKQEYKSAVKDIAKTYNLSPEKVKELESKESLSKVRTLSPEKYQAEFPRQSARTLGCHDPKTGELTFKETGDRESLRHVATHEVMHKASFSETKETDEGTKIISSGLRRTEVDSAGKVIGSKNLYMNEGLTESYTLNSLERRQEREAAEAVTAYYEARVTADKLKGIVGDSKMEAAYFNGELSELEREVNRLGQKDDTWSKLSASLDALYNARDVDSQNQARTEINAILYRMEEFKHAQPKS